MKYNSFIKEHRDITMSGTKRYEDKSGEYYLQNLEKFQKNLNSNKKSITSLNLNNNTNNVKDNINYHSNKYIIKVKKKKICDELIPLPHMKQKNKIKNDYEKKNLYNAMDNAKYLRRYQYSNNISQKQIKMYKEMKKNEKIFLEKVKFIQIWWKTIFQIIKIQKYIRGYLYRIKLISILDIREKYIDKVLHFVKSFKKIFLYKYFRYLLLYNNYQKYYFRKWKDIIFKKIIIKKIRNSYKGNNITLITKKDDIDSDDTENYFNLFRTSINKNKSLMEIYANSSMQNKKKRQKNLSSSSFILKPKKNNLNIGIELSSSQILRKTNKNDFNDINKLNQTNYNRKKKQKSNKNKINNFKNDKNKINTNNNKINIKKKCIKEKSFNDLKSNYKTNYKTKNNNSNKNLGFFNNTNNINNELTKSTYINSYSNNARLSVGGKSNIIKTQKSKKLHKFAESNLSNYSSHIFTNKNNKKKRKKVYENKLNYYNNKLNIENKEKLQPYTESILNESQFSIILNSSTINNDKNTFNFNNETEKTNKTKNNNNCISSPYLLVENEYLLKKFFEGWTKKTIFKLIIKKGYISKNIIIFEGKIMKILKKRLFNIFINKYKKCCDYLNLVDFVEFLNDLKMKIIIKDILYISIKFFLLKYFKIYKDIIFRKIIFENLIEYKINKINSVKKKNKGIKKRNKINLFYSDYDLEHNNFVTEIPFNNYNNNFINNNINLNNNTNNCYIINNLNYNDNNFISKQDDINSFGINPSKIIKYPKNIYRQKKLKQSLALYKFNNNILINDDFNDNNIIDNCSIFQYNINSKIKINKKNPVIYKHNLSKSVLVPNNADYFKPDITAQKNQLTMVINLVERHKKSNNYNLFLSFFKKWKNLINYNIPNINNNSININKNIRNKKNIIKEDNSFKKMKNNNINFSGGTTDFDDLTKNTFATDGFRTESDSKSENKITIKPLSLTSNNKTINAENNKGVYKKKTISINSNKILNNTKKNKINNNENSINKIKLSNNNIHENFEIKEISENKVDKKPLSDKNLNLLTKKNDNLGYSTPEEYFGFKKNNKIEEMEICFFPLSDNISQINTKDNIKKNKYLNSFDNDIINNEKQNEFNEIQQKEIIIEAIEEYNENEGDNGNIIQIIRNELKNEQNNILFKTFSNLKRNYKINFIEQKDEDIRNKSMNDIV